MTKAELKLREMWKQSYIDRLETRYYKHEQSSIDLAVHDWLQMREVMQQAFDYTDDRLDFNETRWYHEWRKSLL